MIYDCLLDGLAKTLGHSGHTSVHVPTKLPRQLNKIHKVINKA
jgi:hypothetical protein